jgi:hypothetical protein
MKLLDIDRLVGHRGTAPPEDHHVAGKRYLVGLLTRLADLESAADERPPAANNKE